jgi:4,5-dihydroxyphthalate decarboxylase
MAQSSTHLQMVIPPAPWTRAMEDGSVTIPGVTWTVNSDINFAPQRFIASGGADVGENGVRRLVIDILNGKRDRALPVFFGREMMQRNFLVRADSNLHHLTDLAGKKVGSRLTISSGTGAAVLMVMEKAYGMDLQSIDWYMGDPAALPSNPMGLKMSRGPDEDPEAYELLLKGELDAVMQTTGPRYLSMFGGPADHVDHDIATYPGTRPLVEDPKEMADAYKRSGLYPISDVVTLKPERVDQNPALARQLVDAFSRANDRADAYSSPEEQAQSRRELELLGDNPHVYGLGENQRANVTAFIDFLYRMGAIERPLPAEDIFYPSSL